MKIPSLDKFEAKSKILESIKANLPRKEICMQLNDYSDLFDMLDPDELIYKDINIDAEEYLLRKLQNYKFPNLVKLKLMLPESMYCDADSIKQAIINHFGKKAQEQLELNHIEKRKWIRGLISGTFFLSICLLGAHLLNQPYFGEYSFAKVLSESLGIIGWVTIWEPATYFLYGKKEGRLLLEKYIILHNLEFEIIKKD